MRPDWNGIYPALTTKLTTDDKLDIPLYLKNIEAQINAGVHGCVIAGSLGEASTLSQKEKISLLDATIAHVDGRIPVVMNIAEQSTAKAVKAANNAQKSGADGLMMLPPCAISQIHMKLLNFINRLLIPAIFQLWFIIIPTIIKLRSPYPCLKNC